jgi:hypothetical protein
MCVSDKDRIELVALNGEQIKVSSRGSIRALKDSAVNEDILIIRLK